MTLFFKVMAAVLIFFFLAVTYFLSLEAQKASHLDIPKKS